MMLFGQPYVALQSPARFYFQNQDDDRRSQSETTIQYCAITLRGFVQKVSSGAIRRDSQADIKKDGSATYEGLPGKESEWNFDYQLSGPGPYFCVRVLERGDGVDWPGMIYYLVLQEDNSTRALGLKDLGAIYNRVGILRLMDMPAKYSTHPYPDVQCKNGKALLTDGEWKDIVLI